VVLVFSHTHYAITGVGPPLPFPRLLGHPQGIYDRLYMLVRKGIADEEFIHIESLLSRVAANLQSLGDR